MFKMTEKYKICFKMIDNDHLCPVGYNAPRITEKATRATQIR